tara:strand:+ start:8858 stop:9709 length:852 start_codon:yes stop_codon:yes gene_type:complete
MSILVVGSNGFLGSHIISECISQNINVIPVNRVKWSQIIIKDLQSWISDYSISDIIFCAGYSKRFSTQEIDNINEIEVISELLKYSSIRFIYLSSALVYGTQDVSSRYNNLTENLNVKPTGVYGMYKRIIERLVLNSNNSNCVLRLVSCIGKKKQSGLMLSIYNKVSQKSNIINMEFADTKRDYLWVKDAAKMIIEIALNRNAKGIYNIGSGKGVRVSNIIKLFAQFYKTKVNSISFGKPMNEDPEELVVSLAKTRSVISKELAHNVSSSNHILKYLHENEHS